MAAVAPLRHANRVERCPLSAVTRKTFALSFSQFDPEPTSQPKVYAIIRARPLPISDDYDIISAAVGSTSEGDARGLAGLRIAETSSQIAAITGGQVPGE
jgi:hypothetical protein